MEIVLDTPRLRLRRFRGDDLDAYAVMCADPEVMRYLGTGATLARPDAWRSIATMLGRVHWGRGYAVEAARTALDYAFGPLGRDRVLSLIRPDNHRSVRVAERLGERLSGEVELLGSKALVYEVRRDLRV